MPCYLILRRYPCNRDKISLKHLINQGDDRMKKIMWLWVGILLTACAQKTSVLTPTSLPTVPSIVTIPAGIAILGRTAEQVDADYAMCLDIAAKTSQSTGICEPKSEVFGDNLYRTKSMGSFKLDIYEAHDANGMPLVTSYEDAVNICKAHTGSLPTADEWEYAARGTTGRLWPNGNNTLTAEDARLDFAGGHSQQSPVKVGSYPKGATPEGLLDMTGNVWEWVQGGIRKGGGAGTILVFAMPYQQTSGDLAGFRCAYAP